MLVVESSVLQVSQPVADCYQEKLLPGNKNSLLILSARSGRQQWQFGTWEPLVFTFLLSPHLYNTTLSAL